MQESLLNTVQKMQSEQKVNVEELETILDSDIEEVVTLCKKACLKPKTDSMGNAYFTKEDINLLRKMKELYSQAKSIQKRTVEETPQATSQIEMAQDSVKKTTQIPNKIDLLTRAKNRLKPEILSGNQNHPLIQFQNKLETLENNLVTKISNVLSEKMDGFDEIIVELIRSKTENENLRQQVNTLNKQIYILKNELASFSPIAFGLYSKKETNEEI